MKAGEEEKEEEEENTSRFMGFSIHACISLKLPPEYPEQASKNQRCPYCVLIAAAEDIGILEVT